MTGLAVRLVGVSHVYTRGGELVHALREVALDVPAGSSVALVGPSGSGKTTVLTLLAGLQRPTAGDVVVGEHQVGEMSESKLLALRAGPVAVVMQEPGRTLLPYGTVADNLQFVRRWARRRGQPAGLATEELLTRLGITALARTPVAALSGGEQQRVSLAAALVHRPGLLLLDEPTNQLDQAHRDAGLRLLDTVREAAGATMVIATHDPAVAARVDQVVDVSDGRLTVRR